MTTQTAYIGLGSNVGNLKDNIETALAILTDHADVSSVHTSSLYATSPLGVVDQAAFLNGVAKIQTSLTARELFSFLQHTEQQMGREKCEHWGPRVIDLDLLLYDDQVIEEADLIVPHPQMHLRSFVLKGLCELSGELIHPRLGRSVTQLYERLNGCDFFAEPERPQLISVAGNMGVGKTTLAAGLAERLEAKFITEKYDENPYLADVYAGRDDLALDSELFFLSSSASQLRKDRLKAGRRYVNDYVFEKAHIYASSWLKSGDLAQYEKHYESICEGVADPVLVIYLVDSVETCMERIHQRNRPYEQQIEMSFLEHLAAGYERLYTDYRVCPVLRLTPEECWGDEQVDRIAEEAAAYIGN